MFRAKTVLVIGAGASAEFGFPLGGKLLDDIARRVDISYDFHALERGDSVVEQALRKALNANVDATCYGEHLRSAWQLVVSSKQGLSIDNVLDALEDEKASLVGKFGIVRSILCAEASSGISKWNENFPDKIDFSAFSGTWLSQMTKILTEGRRKSDIENVFENLSLINFNYDRVVEHYLPFALSSYFGLRPEDVREVMPTLPVFRPYGKAGFLPWETAGQTVAFGRCDARAVEIAAHQILTFTEQVSDRELVSNIQSTIESADRIVFLGFGYHKQNLELLRAEAPRHVEICGTSFGMSASDTSTVLYELKTLFGLDRHFFDREHQFARLHSLECVKFMSEISRTLTGGPSFGVTATGAITPK